jgi:putative addiction module component (TIGR02574 family)
MQNSTLSLGIEKLSASERLALISEIWDSLDAENANLALTTLQSDELARRVADDEQSPEDAVAADVVFAEIETRLNNKS